MSRLFNCFKKSVPLSQPTTKIEGLPKIDGLSNQNLMWTDTLQFIPPVNTGRVIKVYDGDTFTLAGYLPYESSPLYRFSVRLNGIDCAEIKGKSEEEKQCAILARTELDRLIMHKMVQLKNVKNEKYGRLLADVYIDDLHVNQHMLDKGLAVIYDGGTKTTKSWLEIQQKNHI